MLVDFEILDHQDVRHRIIGGGDRTGANATRREAGIPGRESVT